MSGEHVRIQLHPIHGGPWQNRPFKPLCSEIIGTVEKSRECHLAQVKGDNHVIDVKDCSLQVTAGKDEFSICIPLLFMTVSRGALPHYLVLAPQQMAERPECSVPSPAKPIDSIEVNVAGELYSCRSCEKSFCGLRVLPCSTSSAADNTEVCPSCAAGPRAADGWLLILPEGDEATIQAALSMLSKAGAARTDLFSAFDITSGAFGSGTFATAYGVSRKVEADSKTKNVYSDLMIKWFHGLTEEQANTYATDACREVELLAAVQHHDNIVALQGLFLSTDAERNLWPEPPETKMWPQSVRYAMMMRRHRGGDLADLVTARKCDFDEHQAELKISGLLSAVAHLHSRGIVHRDVKADNLLLGHDGSLILADFGLACRLSDEEQMKRRVGSPGYCAPEVIQDEPYDAKVDVFGVGVVLYMLLQRGKMPFFSSDPARVFELVTACEVRFDDSPLHRCQTLSDECMDYVLLLLSKDSADRPTAKDALAKVWCPKKLPQADRISMGSCGDCRNSRRNNISVASTAFRESGCGSTQSKVTYTSENSLCDEILSDSDGKSAPAIPAQGKPSPNRFNFDIRPPPRPEESSFKHRRSFGNNSVMTGISQASTASSRGVSLSRSEVSEETSCGADSGTSPSSRSSHRCCTRCSPASNIDTISPPPLPKEYSCESSFAAPAKSSASESWAPSPSTSSACEHFIAPPPLPDRVYSRKSSCISLASGGQRSTSGYSEIAPPPLPSDSHSRSKRLVDELIAGVGSFLPSSGPEWSERAKKFRERVADAVEANTSKPQPPPRALKARKALTTSDKAAKNRVAASEHPLPKPPPRPTNEKQTKTGIETLSTSRVSSQRPKPAAAPTSSPEAPPASLLTRMRLMRGLRSTGAVDVRKLNEAVKAEKEGRCDVAVC